MATQPLIPLITDADLDLEPLTPDFLSTATSLIGNAADDTDGFPSLLLDLARSFDNMETDLLAGDPEIFDFLSIAGEVNPSSLDSDALTLGDSIAAGNAVLGDFENLVDAGGGPATPSVGTGGMTVGNATGPVLPCPATMGFPSASVQHAPVVRDVQLVNRATTPLHVSKLTLVQADPTVFTGRSDCPSTLAPNSVCTIRITLTRDVPDGTTAQLVAETDSLASPHVLCMVVGATSVNPPPPGGGPIRPTFDF